MKKIKMFYLTDCGYCQKAFRAMEKLKKDPAYAGIDVETIEEEQHPDIANQYDYYATPTFYVDEKKAFEAHIGMSDEDMYREVKKVFDAARS